MMAKASAAAHEKSIKGKGEKPPIYRCTVDGCGGTRRKAGGGVHWICSTCGSSTDPSAPKASTHKIPLVALKLPPPSDRHKDPKWFRERFGGI